MLQLQVLKLDQAVGVEASRGEGLQLRAAMTDELHIEAGSLPDGGRRSPGRLVAASTLQAQPGKVCVDGGSGGFWLLLTG